MKPFQNGRISDLCTMCLEIGTFLKGLKRRFLSLKLLVVSLISSVLLISDF